MKIIALAMCFAFLSAFGQDAPQGKMGPPGVMLRRAESLNQISKQLNSINRSSCLRILSVPMLQPLRLE